MGEEEEEEVEEEEEEKKVYLLYFIQLVTGRGYLIVQLCMGVGEPERVQD